MLDSEWFKRNYGINVKRGDRVIYTGHGDQRIGTVIGQISGHLKIRLDGERNARPYHPTYELTYLTK